MFFVIYTNCLRGSKRKKKKLTHSNCLCFTENDGLPTYEEAIGKVSYPVLPAQDMTENTEMEGTTEQNNDENSSSRPVHTTRRHRRHHRRHFVRMDGSPDGEVDENDGATHAGRRHRRHGRGPGLGRKLAKLNRKRNRNNDSQS